MVTFNFSMVLFTRFLYIWFILSSTIPCSCSTSSFTALSLFNFFFASPLTASPPVTFKTLISSSALSTATSASDDFREITVNSVFSSCDSFSVTFSFPLNAFSTLAFSSSSLASFSRSFFLSSICSRSRAGSRGSSISSRSLGNSFSGFSCAFRGSLFRSLANCSNLASGSRAGTSTF